MNPDAHEEQTRLWLRGHNELGRRCPARERTDHRSAHLSTCGRINRCTQECARTRTHTCTDTHVKGGGAHPGHSHLTQGLSDVQRGQTEEEREQERWHFPMLHKPGGKCGDRAI